MIIVEGADGTGKSELVNALCKDLGLQKGGKWGGYDLDEVNRDMRDELLPKTPRERTYHALAQAMNGPVRVYDRLFWSEIIYGQVLRDKVQFSAEEQFRIMAILKAMWCPIIFCHVPWPSTVEDLEKNTPQLEGWTMEKAEDIWSLYGTALDMASWKGLRVVGYDFTEEYNDTAIWRPSFLPYETLLGVVAGYLEERRRWTV